MIFFRTIDIESSKAYYMKAILHLVIGGKENMSPTQYTAATNVFWYLVIVALAIMGFHGTFGKGTKPLWRLISILAFVFCGLAALKLFPVFLQSIPPILGYVWEALKNFGSQAAQQAGTPP
jgi:hypothetical protein